MIMPMRDGHIEQRIGQRTQADEYNGRSSPSNLEPIQGPSEAPYEEHTTYFKKVHWTPAQKRERVSEATSDDGDDGNDGDDGDDNDDNNNGGNGIRNINIPLLYLSIPVRPITREPMDGGMLFRYTHEVWEDESIILGYIARFIEVTRGIGGSGNVEKRSELYEYGRFTGRTFGLNTVEHEARCRAHSVTNRGVCICKLPGLDQSVTATTSGREYLG